MTPQRMAILKALLAADHPTVDEVYEAVRHDFPMTSPVTVYRTMAMLRDMGEVIEVDSSDPVARYDAHRPYQHPHLVCGHCGRVMDSPDAEIEGLLRDLQQRAGRWTLSREVYFYGICPECRERGATGDPDSVSDH
jgi:Fur family peroxide stress response transcriptional regulator